MFQDGEDQSVGVAFFGRWACQAPLMANVIPSRTLLAWEGKPPSSKWVCKDEEGNYGLYEEAKIEEVAIVLPNFAANPEGPWNMRTENSFTLTKERAAELAKI